QELSLPNLAYVGGGAEIVYWMQLKWVFVHYQLPFPILIPRNSAMVTDRTAAAKLTRFDLSFTDVFRPLAELQNTYVRNHSTQRLDLREEWTELNTILDAVRARAEVIDPTLGPSAEAVRARVERAFTRLEKKMLRAGKRQHVDALGQLARLKEKLFPGGGLQERTENFGLLYVKHGPALIETLIQHFRPLDFKFTILAPQCSRKPEGLS